MAYGSSAVTLGEVYTYIIEHYLSGSAPADTTLTDLLLTMGAAIQAGASGSVHSVSVVSANGFAGTVATPTTTPAITMSTSITGLLKGNGTAISAASAGTDYLTPTGNGSGLTGITASQVSGGMATATYDPAAIAQQVVGTTASQTLTNKTLTTPVISSITNTGTLTLPTSTDTLVGRATTDTLTNKTLTSPVIGTIVNTGTLTLPTSTDTLVGRATTDTLTNKTLTSPAVTSLSGTQTNVTNINNAVTVTSNAGTVPITSKLNTFTNSSAATMTITMATASAVDGQASIVRIYDFSAAAETISWVNTENSQVSVPTTSNGSTTLPLTVGFMFNSATTKWRCVASA